MTNAVRSVQDDLRRSFELVALLAEDGRQRLALAGEVVLLSASVVSSGSRLHSDLVECGLKLVDLGQEGAAFVIVLLLLGKRLGVAVFGGLGLNVDLLLIDVRGRFEVLPHVDVVERKLGRQERQFSISSAMRSIVEM